MLDTVFRGLFDSDITTVIRVSDFLLCLGCALILGLIMAFAYMYRTRYTKSFVVTLALLPAVVCVVIMLVNGNVGTGVAVAGAFSLVRFRSVPGTAKEICTLFLAMGAGLIAGMGYLGFAVLFTVIMCAMFLLYNRLDFGAKKNAATYKTLAITIPEDLDYTGALSFSAAQAWSLVKPIRLRQGQFPEKRRQVRDIVMTQRHNNILWHRFLHSDRPLPL